ncbi:hypothetical protein [Streptomyces sp. NPDC047043]|uniref:hypothetical protein n=1 Tax=Streptomyces sp. NPDC047043 TaxID=3154497 RepID=UPI0033C575F3
MDFTPVRNGMDFLLSAFDHLSQSDGSPEARDVKYAVLHLQAAVEVLLKARLIREHWSLVFSEPGKAKRVDYEAGRFASCTVLGAIDRLNNIVSLQISKEQRQAISSLADTRNALTHLGHSGSVFAVEAQAALVLDFLLTFVHEHLQPALTKDGPYVHETMEKLGARLASINALVRQRRGRLKQELESVQERVVDCPMCGEEAIVLGDTPPTCRFCMTAYDDVRDLSILYKEMGRGDATFNCPSCEGCLTVVAGARHASGRTVDICFACADIFEGWARCARCEEGIFFLDMGREVCTDCATGAGEWE